MNDRHKEYIENLEKLNEAFLYDIGAEYAALICEETDQLMEKFEDLEISESMNQKFYSFLKELETKERNEKRRKRFNRFTKRVAVVLLVAGAGLSAITIGVDAFRVKFFNILIETTEKFGLVSYEEKTTYNKITAPDDWTDYYPAYMPEEYSLVESEAGAGVSILRYVNEKGEILELIQGTVILTSQIDTEDATVVEVEVNGESSIIVEKDDETIIGWSKKEESFILRGNLDKSELLEIAESITQKNKKVFKIL